MELALQLPNFEFAIQIRICIFFLDLPKHHHLVRNVSFVHCFVCICRDASVTEGSDVSFLTGGERFQIGNVFFVL